jgi:hypothetical protein
MQGVKPHPSESSFSAFCKARPLLAAFSARDQGGPELWPVQKDLKLDGLFGMAYVMLR